MREIKQERLTGERALFHEKELLIQDTIFADGESPLKESCDITLKRTSFQWKYPLWYCQRIRAEDCCFEEMARAGVWYTDHVSMKDTLYGAPKGFRRVHHLEMEHVDLPLAEETLWQCSDVQMKHVTAKGDYFAMNCEGVQAQDFRLIGNYCFDGCRNVEIRDAKLLSKDAFWNCDQVTVYDSYICGEYLGWNSRNVTFVDCVIESLQGMCYMENLVMRNCRLLNTTLAFEYSTVDAEICSRIDSIKNPKSGMIRVEGIDELIMDENEIDPARTEIIIA